MVYVAFVIDAYSRLIPKLMRRDHDTHRLVLDALEHAVRTRRQQGVDELGELVHHSDAGSPYTSIAFTEGVAEACAAPSVGTRAMPTTMPWLIDPSGSLFQDELIKPRGPGRTVEQVEVATLEYVD